MPLLRDLLTILPQASLAHWLLLYVVVLLRLCPSDLFLLEQFEVPELIWAQGALC